MCYSYVEIEYVATSFSPARTDLAVKLLRINMWNHVETLTPAITRWFPEQWLLGFFILEKQLASQDMFLIRSELSITVYLFLVLYRSTSLQSLSFLKHIETFLCKYKLVNIIVVFLQSNSVTITIVSQKYRGLLQPYSHDRSSKTSRTFCASRN
jgi:hypothetical protein